MCVCVCVCVCVCSCYVVFGMLFPTKFCEFNVPQIRVIEEERCRATDRDRLAGGAIDFLLVAHTTLLHSVFVVLC